MSLITIRVELPAYSHSFTVQVSPASTILDVKHAIFTSCVGRPRPEGQRIIWRGRYLHDGEKTDELWPLSDEQPIVHLSILPSAWSSTPPSCSRSSTPPVNTRKHAVSQIKDESLTFVHHIHWKALYVLSNYKLAPPPTLSDVPTRRSIAKLALERRGYAWPSILDDDFLDHSAVIQNHVDYDIVAISGKSFLSLREPRGMPSDVQLHALRVLTYTFSILSLPPTMSPIPTPIVPETPSVPPEINELLQHLGLPTLGAVPNANVGVAAPPGPVPAGPAAAEHVEANFIPIRALLAPLVMLVLRTVILLYFFAPTRKPILGLCIAAWIVYEMWTHVRIVILRPLNRAAGNGAAADNGDRATPVPPTPANGQGNGHVPPVSGAPNSNNDQSRPDQSPQGPPLPEPSQNFIDGLALLNVHNENKLLWPTSTARVPDPPTLTHKATTFLSLLMTTLHPEVYDRRMTAMRQREGRLITEMNAMERVFERSESGGPTEEEVRRQEHKEQLRAQHDRRAAWVREYAVRVRGGDWIDE